MPRLLVYLKRFFMIATLLLVSFSPGVVIAEGDNDNFSNATEIANLPFEDYADVAGKTLEPGEPTPSMCVEPGFTATWSYWYKITPSAENVYFLNVESYVSGTSTVDVYSAYQGGSFENLELWNCIGFPEYGGVGSFEFEVLPVNTYYIQISGDVPYGTMRMMLDQQLPLTADFEFRDSGFGFSKFDTIKFTDSSFDPTETGIQQYDWDFGDGVTESSNVDRTMHRYTSDGVYTVTHTITTIDGRKASVSKDVTIATHDVVITRIVVPEDAKSGQTRSIQVYVANLYYPETVFIEIEKYPGEGGNMVTLLPKNVDYPTTLPVTKLSKPVVINFEYTFTPRDVEVGKVTFAARAHYDAWVPPYPDDCCSYDNVLRSPPVRIDH